MNPDQWHTVVVVVLVIMNSAAAVLPSVGLFRIARRAWGTLREAVADESLGQGPAIHMTTPDGRESTVGWGEMLRGFQAASTGPRAGWKEARLDVLLVGGGIVLGSAASIWSLFL